MMPELDPPEFVCQQCGQTFYVSGPAPYFCGCGGLVVSVAPERAKCGQCGQRLGKVTVVDPETSEAPIEVVPGASITIPWSDAQNSYIDFKEPVLTQVFQWRAMDANGQMHSMAYLAGVEVRVVVQDIHERIIAIQNIQRDPEPTNDELHQYD